MKGDPTYKKYNETIKNMSPPASPGTSRMVQVPWWWEEIGVKSLFKMLGKISIYLIVVWILYYFFQFWFLLGLLPIPFWCGYLYYILDKENILLLEYRIKGEEIKDQEDKIQVTVKNSHVKLYKIPPEIWKKLDKIGEIFQVSDKFYVCDYYKPGGKKVFFSVHKSFSNINFRKEHLWLDLKNIVPTLEKKLVYLVEGFNMSAMNKALEIYAQTRNQEELFIHGMRVIGQYEVKQPDQEEAV